MALAIWASFPLEKDHKTFSRPLTTVPAVIEQKYAAAASLQALMGDARHTRPPKRIPFIFCLNDTKQIKCSWWHVQLWKNFLDRHKIAIDQYDVSFYVLLHQRHTNIFFFFCWSCMMALRTQTQKQCGSSHVNYGEPMAQNSGRGLRERAAGAAQSNKVSWMRFRSSCTRACF